MDYIRDGLKSTLNLLTYIGLVRLYMYNCTCVLYLDRKLYSKLMDQV